MPASDPRPRVRRPVLGSGCRPRNDVPRGAAAARYCFPFGPDQPHLVAFSNLSLFGTGSFPYIPNATNRHRRCAGGGSPGVHMGRIREKLIDKTPDLIGKASQNTLGSHL